MKKSVRTSVFPHSISLFLLILIGLLTGVCSTQLNAQGTPKISIQGTLKSANGTSVPDGQYAVRFNLYTTPIGGTAVWHEDTLVDVIGSIYSHYLGSVVPLNPADFSNTLYLGVKVGSYELIPRSELAYAPYSFSVTAAQTVVCSGAVGDIKYSILNPTQFDAVNGDCWVPMDGRALATTDKLRQITGMANVPDGGGLFVRAQEFSTSPDRDLSRTSASAIATLEAEAIQSHNHGVSDPGHNHGYSDTRQNGDDGAKCGCAGQSAPASASTINDNETTNGSTTGISIQNTGGPETRPKNLNFWVYIRIN
ncbi:MAG: hypothetical protein ABIO24_07720 [Saprospiraceae bacterium]